MGKYPRMRGFGGYDDEKNDGAAAALPVPACACAGKDGDGDTRYYWTQPIKATLFAG